MKLPPLRAIVRVGAPAESLTVTLNEQALWSRQASVCPPEPTVPVAELPVGEPVGPTVTIGVAARATPAVDASMAMLTTSARAATPQARRPILVLSPMWSSLERDPSNIRGPECPRTSGATRTSTPESLDRGTGIPRSGLARRLTRRARLRGRAYKCSGRHHRGQFAMSFGVAAGLIS